MKAKREYIILVVVVLVLGLYLIFRTSDRSQYVLPQMPAVDGTKVTKIEIIKPGATIILDKEGDDWKLSPQGHAADSTKVKSMLETIEGLAVTALVSESKSYARYDLDTEKKITVKAWVNDRPVREFDLGKAAPSFRHTFVKLAGDGHIYHAGGNFRTTFDLTAGQLRDKVVLSFEPAEIEKIRIVKDKEDLTFARAQLPVEVIAGEAEPEPEGAEPPAGGLIWQTADGKQAKENELTRLISTLSNLRCENYIADKKKEDFSDPIFEIKLTGAQEYSLSVFAKTEEEAGNYPAISSANDDPFLLSRWQADNLMKDPEALLEETKPDSEKTGSPDKEESS